MVKYQTQIIRLLLCLVAFFLIGCSPQVTQPSDSSPLPETTLQTHEATSAESSMDIQQRQYYYARDDVAQYIHLYGTLPDNYITKAEAEERNWTPQDSTYVVGGDRFGNHERLLPTALGRQYYEADVQAGYTHHRGPECIVYSNDGLIYYTDDHYDSFEQLY